MNYSKIITFILLLSSCSVAFSQKKMSVTGQVIDKSTKESVPFATVAIKGKAAGTTANAEGHFTLPVPSVTDSLVITFMGYKPEVLALPLTLDKPLVVELVAEGIALQEVVIRAGENPVWQIIRNVRSHRETNSKLGVSAYQYASYNRTEIGVKQIASTLKNSKYVGKVVSAANKLQKVVDENGDDILPIFISETSSEVFHRSSPKTMKELVKKQQSSGVGLQDNEAIDQLIGSLTKEFNFYDNYVRVLSKEFLSPINESWKITYDYQLIDSTLIGGRLCYLIDYQPKNPLDLAFTGRLWIDKTTWAILSIDADVSDKANINYVHGVAIQQEYDFIENKVWLPTSLKVALELEDPFGSIGRLKAKLTVANDQYVLDVPKPLAFYENKIEWAEKAKETDEAYWQQNRPAVLSDAERTSYAVIDSIKNLREVKQFTRIANVLGSGYVANGLVDIGPLPLMYAYNTFEGHRFRVGLRTNQFFSRNLFLKGYVAYGTRDNRPKFGLDATYVLSKQRYSAIQANLTSDVEQMGLATDDFGGNQLSNSLFRAFNRFGQFRRAFYQTSASMAYTFEPVQTLSASVGFSARHFAPTYPFSFGKTENTVTSQPEQRSFINTFLFGELRYAPGEITARNNKNRKVRIRRAREYPVLTLRYEGGMQALGGQFNYHKLTLGVQKSFHLGMLGRTDTELALGYTPSVLPYPILFIHQGNPSPLYAPNAYNLMRPFEFVSDKYASWQFQHNFEGLLTNRLPVIKQLNWRTHLTGKILWGNLSKRNQAFTPEFGTQGDNLSKFGYLKPNMPYAEVGYGISNIFKFLRVDFIHRLTYRQQMQVPKFQVKVGVDIRL